MKNVKRRSKYAMSVQVITLGSASEDLFVLTNESQVLPGHIATCEKLLAFELGAKIPVGRIKNCIGGAGASVATGLAKLDIKVSSCVALGDDEIGGKIKTSLSESGVDTELCHIAAEHASDRSVILVEPISRDRTIFYSRDAGEHLKLKNISKWRTEWVFISSLVSDWRNKLSQILKLRKERGAKIAWNPGRAQIKAGVQFLLPLLRETTLLFLNWDEALELALSDKTFKEKYVAQKPGKKAVLKFLHGTGVQVPIITLGKKGSLATNGYYFYKAPVLTPKRVELTGAGDAYCSGFLASWIQEPDNLRRAMGWGMANSGSVVLYFGAQKGLLGLNEIKRKANEKILEVVIEEKRL